MTLVASTWLRSTESAATLIGSAAVMLLRAVTISSSSCSESCNTVCDRAVSLISNGVSSSADAAAASLIL
jgi:hypothetical protein